MFLYGLNLEFSNSSCDFIDSEFSLLLKNILLILDLNAFSGAFLIWLFIVVSSFLLLYSL